MDIVNVRRAHDPAAERRFALLVTGTFVILTVPRLWAHEMWRDETLTWLIVSEARSLSDVFVQLERGGEGYLWTLLCYAVRLLIDSPRAMQLLHLAIAAAGLFIFVHWAPLARWQRALFALGYFPFYEYAVISRLYAIGVLLVWVACAAVATRRPALAFGAVLCLLFQTNVYGYIIALALLAGWLVDRWQRRGEVPPLGRGEVTAGLALVIVGAIAGIIQLVPRPGTTFASEWTFGWDATKALLALEMPWRAAAPVPKPMHSFWSSNLLDSWPLVQRAAGAALLIGALIFLRRSKPALTTFALGAVALLAFGYVKFFGALRHHGHLWVLFFAALWLAGGLGRLDGRWRWRSAVLAVLLLTHAAVGVFASLVDLYYPFSNGPAMAVQMRALPLDEVVLFGYREPPVSSVALPLGRPFYAPSRDVFATHPEWRPGEHDLPERQVRCSARALAVRAGRDVLVLTSRRPFTWPELVPAGSTQGAILNSEDYYLYRLPRSALAATAALAACPGEMAESGTAARNQPSAGGADW
jgi:hypothetical protein